MEKHKIHEAKESLVREATEYIEEPKKIPYIKETYGKMPELRGKK